MSRPSGESDLIEVLVHKHNFFIFSPSSLLNCHKLNLRVALIGPPPRLLTTDKTHLPGQLNTYQTEYLIRHHLNHVRFYDATPSSAPLQPITQQHEDLLVQIDHAVTEQHHKIAETYNHRAKPVVYGERPYRWQVNFIHSEWPLIERLESTLKSGSVERERYAIYEHFTKNGYWLTTGLQYGCDWLAYRGSPDLFHSECLVYCVDYKRSLGADQLLRLTRIGSKTNKRLILASVVDNDRVIGTSITWSNRG